MLGSTDTGFAYWLDPISRAPTRTSTLWGHKWQYRRCLSILTLPHLCWVFASTLGPFSRDTFVVSRVFLLWYFACYFYFPSLFRLCPIVSFGHFTLSWQQQPVSQSPGFLWPPITQNKIISMAACVALVMTHEAYFEGNGATRLPLVAILFYSLT